MIPVRDRSGRIQGIQIRSDAATGDRRYRWLSSPQHEPWTAGASSGAPVRVAGRSYWAAGWPLWITEGPLKADVTSYYIRHTVLGIPGVNLWGAALPTILAFHPNQVVIGFDEDLDPATREAVARHVRGLTQELRNRRVRVLEARWTQGKGVDDALTAGERPEFRRVD
jgi:hypothetical protein